MIRFIPESVVLGFTAGIAIVIWVGQLENFFGLPKVSGVSLVERLPQLLDSLPHLHPATTALGIASLVIVVFWSKDSSSLARYQGRWWRSSPPPLWWPRCTLRASRPSARYSAGFREDSRL